MHLGRPEAAGDKRFSTGRALIANWQAVSSILIEAFAARPFGYWREHFKTFTGQWAPAQNMLEFGQDCRPPAPSS